MSIHLITDLGLAALASPPVSITKFKVGSAKVTDVLPTTGPVLLTGTLLTLPIKPGSINFAAPAGAAPVETFTDDGAGILVGSKGGNGTIDYHSGAIQVTFADSLVLTGMNVAINYQYAGQLASSESKGAVAPGVVAGFVASSTYARIVKGSITLAWSTAPTVPIASDDSLGNITGPYITGTVTYTSGAILLNFAGGNPGGTLLLQYTRETLTARTDLVNPYGGTRLIAAVNPVGSGIAEFQCLLPDNDPMGDGEIGEIALFLSDGTTMFSAAPTNPVIKRVTIPGRLGNRVTFRVQIQYANIAALVSFIEVNPPPDEFSSAFVAAARQTPPPVPSQVGTAFGSTAGASGISGITLAAAPGQWILLGLARKASAPSVVGDPQWTNGVTTQYFRRIYSITGPAPTNLTLELFALKWPAPAAGGLGQITWDNPEAVQWAGGYAVVEGVGDIQPRGKLQNTTGQASVTQSFANSRVVSFLAALATGTPVDAAEIPGLTGYQGGLGLGANTGNSPGVNNLTWDTVPGVTFGVAAAVELVYMDHNSLVLPTAQAGSLFHAGRRVKAQVNPGATDYYDWVSASGYRVMGSDTEVTLEGFVLATVGADYPATLAIQAVASTLANSTNHGEPRRAVNSEWSEDWLDAIPNVLTTDVIEHAVVIDDSNATAAGTPPFVRIASTSAAFAVPSPAGKALFLAISTHFQDSAVIEGVTCTDGTSTFDMELVGTVARFDTAPGPGSQISWWYLPRVPATSLTFTVALARKETAATPITAVAVTVANARAVKPSNVQSAVVQGPAPISAAFAVERFNSKTLVAASLNGASGAITRGGAQTALDADTTAPDGVLVVDKLTGLEGVNRSETVSFSVAPTQPDTASMLAVEVESLSSCQFLLTGDYTSRFAPGRRVRMLRADGQVLQSRVKESSFSGGNTTVEILDPYVDAYLVRVDTAVAEVSREVRDPSWAEAWDRCSYNNIGSELAVVLLDAGGGLDLDVAGLRDRYTGGRRVQLRSTDGAVHQSIVKRLIVENFTGYVVLKVVLEHVTTAPSVPDYAAWSHIRPSAFNTAPLAGQNRGDRPGQYVLPEDGLPLGIVSDRVILAPEELALYANDHDMGTAVAWAGWTFVTNLRNFSHLGPLQDKREIRYALLSVNVRGEPYPLNAFNLVAGASGSLELKLLAGNVVRYFKAQVFVANASGNTFLNNVERTVLVPVAPDVPNLSYAIQVLPPVFAALNAARWRVEIGLLGWVL